MTHRIETAKATALAKIREAEQAEFLCLLEQAKEDLGRDLAAFLDCSTAFIEHGLGHPATRWQVGQTPATLALRFPDSTEIFVQYRREQRDDAPSNLMCDVQDWVPQLWFPNPRLTRFAAVSYRLDNIQMKVDQWRPEWFFTDDIDHAKLAAKKFYKDKLDMLAEAKRLQEQAVEEKLRRFR